MVRKNPPTGYGKYSPGEYRDNLANLEAYFGSRAKAAKHLGISTKTFTNHLTGKTIPKKEVSRRTNRVVGQLKEKLKSEKTQTTRRKKEEKAAKRLERENQKVNYLSTREWVRTYRPELSAQINEVMKIAPYVAYQGSNTHMVQFTDMFAPLGRPAGVNRVKVWAIYSPAYDHNKDIPPMIIGSEKHILNRRKMDLSISEVNEILVKSFSGDYQQKGRVKFLMSGILGFESI
ncbi:hypothetical protein D3C73_957530 [compost metagenome]